MNLNPIPKLTAVPFRARRRVGRMPARFERAVWLLAVLALAGAGAMAWAQGPAMPSYDPSQGPVYGQRSSDSGGSAEDGDPLAEKRLRALNAARQKALVADTDRLLKLANELNAEIAAANAGSLGPIQLRKLAEIEKLARSVKEKMSTSVRPSSPSFLYTVPTPYH